MSEEIKLSEVAERSLFLMDQLTKEAKMAMYSPGMLMFLELNKDLALSHHPDARKRIHDTAMRMFEAIGEVSAAEIMVVLDAFMTYVYQEIPDVMKAIFFKVKSPVKLDTNILNQAGEELKKLFDTEAMDDE